MARESTKICIDCRRLFTSKHPLQVRCRECQNAHTKANREKWKKAQMAELKKAQDPNECQRKDTCIYAANAGGIKICDYYSITGERRGCPVQGCTKYESDLQNRKQEVDNG